MSIVLVDWAKCARPISAIYNAETRLMDGSLLFLPWTVKRIFIPSASQYQNDDKVWARPLKVGVKQPWLTKPRERKMGSPVCRASHSIRKYTFVVSTRDALVCDPLYKRLSLFFLFFFRFLTPFFLVRSNFYVTLRDIIASVMTGEILCEQRLIRLNLSGNSLFAQLLFMQWSFLFNSLDFTQQVLYNLPCRPQLNFFIIINIMKKI